MQAQMRRMIKDGLIKEVMIKQIQLNFGFEKPEAPNPLEDLNDSAEDEEEG